MANVVYTSKVRVTTIPLRDLAYEKIRDLTTHLGQFGANLVSIVVEADKSITVTLTGALPVEQVDHLGLVGPI
jgi:hypothetical protein